VCARCASGAVCPINTFSVSSGATSCTACTAGSTSPAGSTTCTCSSGFSTSGAAASLACTGSSRARAWTPTLLRLTGVDVVAFAFVSRASTACVAGTFSSSGIACSCASCVPAELGWVRAKASCPLGPWQNRVWVGAAACLSGSFSPSQASTCTSCPSNSASSSSASTCACNAGYSGSGSGLSLACTGAQLPAGDGVPPAAF